MASATVTAAAWEEATPAAGSSAPDRSPALSQMARMLALASALALVLQRRRGLHGTSTTPSALRSNLACVHRCLVHPGLTWFAYTSEGRRGVHGGSGAVGVVMASGGGVNVGAGAGRPQRPASRPMAIPAPGCPTAVSSGTEHEQERSRGPGQRGSPNAAASPTWHPLHFGTAGPWQLETSTGAGKGRAQKMAARPRLRLTPRQWRRAAPAAATPPTPRPNLRCKQVPRTPWAGQGRQQKQGTSKGRRRR
jgi:hypothetical protein